MLRIAICDDTKEDRDRMYQYVQQFCQESMLQAEIEVFDHPDTLICACEKLRPQIYILDIVMPMVNGIQAARELRWNQPDAEIIFATSEESYALESFDVNPVNYILKPVQKEKLFAAMISAYMIPLFLIYQVKSIRKLANFMFYMVGTMSMEIVLGISAGYLNNEMGFHTRYELLTPQIALLMNFIEILLVLLICRFGSKEKEKKQDKMIFILMAMPLVSVVLIVGDMILLGMGMYEHFNPEQFLRTAVLLVIVNIAIFIVLEKYTGLMRREMELVQEKSRLKSDADIMELAAKSMKERLQSAETVMQRDRMMRHDRRHFEALLYQLLEEGRTEEAKKYLAERLAMEPQVVRKYCENTTVNAVISHHISWAEREGIRTTVAANIPSELSVDEMELAIAISNLLENAVCACMKLPETQRYLKLTAKYKNQLFSLHTWLNKLTGVGVFLLPYVLVVTDGVTYTWAVCVLAFVSSVEELLHI